MPKVRVRCDIGLKHGDGLRAGKAVLVQLHLPATSFDNYISAKMGDHVVPYCRGFELLAPHGRLIILVVVAGVHLELF